MVSNGDVEKDVEKGTSSTESTAYYSDVDKAGLRNIEGAVGEPDSDHDEVEQMDEGHLDDLARERVRKPHLSADCLINSSRLLWNRSKLGMESQERNQRSSEYQRSRVRRAKYPE
jgi:hypothetical protein